MKVWQSFGAEHSLNLVLIGHFKEPSDAEDLRRLINETANFLREQDSFDVEADRYSENVSDYLSNKNMFCLSPHQLGHLLYDYSMEVIGSDIHISSDDDLHGLISLMIHHGAKVEVFSAHNYPESDK